jgi:ATP-dependent Clp protease protease subunit
MWLPATDLEIEAREILRLRSRLYQILAEHTGKDVAQIQKDCDRNLWLEAEESVQYGLADAILRKEPEIKHSKIEE